MNSTKFFIVISAFFPCICVYILPFVTIQRAEFFIEFSHRARSWNKNVAAKINPAEESEKQYRSLILYLVVYIVLLPRL